jgi:glycosyltransferase involved in cell wall biosynthesis
MKIKYSIVAPIFNELDNLPELHRRVGAVMSALDGTWELILVDDGSTDGSTEAIRALAREDRHVRAVIFARGDAVVIIDADLQDPPEAIPSLVEKWKEGYQVVYAVRAEREGETLFKKLSAALFYRVIFRITDVKIPLDTGDFRLMDRKVVDVLKTMRERHRFPRGMSAWVGFKQVGVPYKRAARYAGVTKYPFRKMLKLALNAITGFSYFPLQLATYFGFASAGLAAIVIPVVIIMRLMGSQFFIGQASTLIAVLFLGGVQLISLGVLGEYLGRIYDEAKGRPLYILSEDPE